MITSGEPVTQLPPHAPDLSTLLHWGETANADRLVAAHGHDLRYSPERRKYYVWDKRRWVLDPESLELGRRAETTLQYCLLQILNIPNPKLVDKLTKIVMKAMDRRSLDNIIHLARKKVQAVYLCELDADPWLLNCRNGVVNLKTGVLLPHARDYLCSKLIPLDYDPRAQCPLFHAFLERIMGGGPAAAEEQAATALQLIDCLQRLFGCGATGMFEKLLAVLFGIGNNGKTTLMEIVRKALGGKEYAGCMQISTLMATAADSGSGNAIYADIADLRGCRLVTSSEPEEGRNLSVNRVKYLTGGGEIKARYLGENPFTFHPSHTIFLDTNHPPVITNANDAVWNRVKCIPFTVAIPTAEIDNDLPAKLERELPGILAWIVEGAVLYANCGLYFPPAVHAATEEYRGKSDHLPVFIDDMCVRRQDRYVHVAKFRAVYEAWIAASGEEKLSAPDFKQRMLQAGFKYDCVRDPAISKHQQVRVWRGIELRAFKGPVSMRPSDAS